jgi:hypothetical protein
MASTQSTHYFVFHVNVRPLRAKPPLDSSISQSSSPRRLDVGKLQPVEEEVVKTAKKVDF